MGSAFSSALQPAPVFWSDTASRRSRESASLFSILDFILHVRRGDCMIPLFFHIPTIVITSIAPIDEFFGQRGAAFGHRLEGCRLLIKRPACLLFFHYSFGTVLFSVAWSVLCAHACGKQPKMIPLRHSLHGRLLWREPIVYSHSL